MTILSIIRKALHTGEQVEVKVGDLWYKGEVLEYREKITIGRTGAIWSFDPKSIEDIKEKI